MSDHGADRRCGVWHRAILPVVLLLACAQTPAADFPPGQIIDSVVCAGDPSQTYTLYLPSGYSPTRVWPVIFAFDPGGRGRNPVDRYQAAAEQYGFIVAGSNNSRNGMPDIRPPVKSMTADVMTRFSIDPRRIYLAGMSGGSRVAMAVALTTDGIAGVFASSAGYPDGEPRKTVPFPIFATAGTEDFNHLEMRRLDAALTTPHHLTIFQGGHIWLSSALAMEAVEWMEIQAMKAGLKPRDDGEIDRLLAKRMARADSAQSQKDAFLVLQSIAADFEALRDVSSAASRAEALMRDKRVRDALKADRDDDQREEQLLQTIASMVTRLEDDEQRPGALSELRLQVRDLSSKSKRPDDSLERQRARRVLAQLSAGAVSRDPDYLKILAEYGVGRGRGRGF